MDYPAPVQRLIDELRHLPGVGPKHADDMRRSIERLVGHVNGRYG